MKVFSRSTRREDTMLSKMDIKRLEKNELSANEIQAYQEYLAMQDAKRSKRMAECPTCGKPMPKSYVKKGYQCDTLTLAIRTINDILQDWTK